MTKLNPSIKYHTLVGIFISIWIFIFTYFIRPFDGNAYNFYWWEFLSIGFSLITFISYFIIVVVLQDSIYRKTTKWNIIFEIFTISSFLFLNLILNYLYYKSPFLNGIWAFSEYINGVSIKTSLQFDPASGYSILIISLLLILMSILLYLNSTEKRKHS